MEDSVCPSLHASQQSRDSSQAASAHLLGALLDGFLESAMDRVSSGTEDELFALAQRGGDPRIASLHVLADAAVDLLADQLTSSSQDALECLESLERARKEPLLRELVLPEWDRYFRASVSPKKIYDQLLERLDGGLSLAKSPAEREEALIALAQSAVFLTSLTSQLKNHLEQVFAQEPLLAWMSRWSQ